MLDLGTCIAPALTYGVAGFALGILVGLVVGMILGALER